MRRKDGRNIDGETVGCGVVVWLIASLFIAGGIGSMTSRPIGCIVFGSLILLLLFISFIGWLFS